MSNTILKVNKMGQEMNKKKQQTIENMFARLSDINKQKKNQQQNSIEPPVSFATFQRFIANLPEIVSQYMHRNEATDESPPLTFDENEAKAYYHDFYAKPEIRSMYPFKLKPCPSSIRNKLLQLPKGGEKQRIQEEASSVSHKNNQDQLTINNKGISFDDYNFPVTYEMFKKHVTNQKSLVKNVIKYQYKPKTKEEFKSLYNDKKCYKHTLRLCYKEYYTNPVWRNRYKCEFQDAPRELLTKLLSFGSQGRSESDDNNEGSSVDVPNPLKVNNQKEIERFKRRIPSSYDDLVKQCFSELPLTQDQFYDKIRNSRKILKEILQFISKDDLNIYHALLFNDEMCQHILREYYLLFYVFPLVRGIFEIKLKSSCPSAVKELLENVPKITNFLEIDFPIQLKTFKKYANYEEILNQIIPIFGCEDKKLRQKMRSDKMICKRLFEEFFVSYYLAPIITRELINCKFGNAPADLRIKLIGGDGGNSSIDEKQSSSLSSSAEENDYHKQQEEEEQQQNIAHTSYLNMNDFIFPVSFETFRKYIDYDEVIDSLIKPLSHGDKKKYEKLRQDEIFCQARFNTYFYWFYREPKIRSVYKFNFNKAPESLMEKLLSFATRKSQENITTSVQEENHGTAAATTTIQKEPQVSKTRSNKIIEEKRNQELYKEVDHSREAIIMPSEIEMLEDQEAPPFLVLHATYQADPEDEIEQYAIESNNDDDDQEENITPDELNLEDVEPQNTHDVAMEDISRNHNLAIHEMILEEDNIETEPYVVEETIPNNSDDINQNQHLALHKVILEGEDIAMDLVTQSNESNSMSVEAISLEEIIQQLPATPSPKVHASVTPIEEVLTMSNQVQGAEGSQDIHNIAIHSICTADSISIEEIPPEELIQQLPPPVETQIEVELTMYNQDQETDKNQDHYIIIHSDGSKITSTEEQSPEGIIQQLPSGEAMVRNELETILSNTVKKVETNQNRYVDVHSILVNESLNFPTSLKTFKSLITNIDDLVSRLAEEFSQTHGPMFLASEMRSNFELELYRLFYLLPEIRNFYEFRMKPCPSRTKEAFLQIPNCFDNNINIKLPVTIDIFREFINYNEILDQMIRTFVTNDDEEDYAKARNDESLCNRFFQSFYYSFYLTPIIIRGTFLYKFHNAPSDLKIKLHQFAILIIENGDGDNNVEPSSSNNQGTTTSPIVNCDINKENLVVLTSQPKENLIQNCVILCAATTTSATVNCNKVNDRETIQRNPIETHKEIHHKEIDHSDGVEVMPPPTNKLNEQISLNAKDWIFPVTIDIFKKSINYKEIMDKHLKSLIKGDEKQLEKIRNNEKLCSAQFRRIYYTFYIKPELRNRIKYNFDAAPNELKEKLLSFAIPKIQKTTEQKESDVNKDRVNDSDKYKNTNEERRPEALIPVSNELTKEICAGDKGNDSDMLKKTDTIAKVQNTEALLIPTKPSELIINKDNASAGLLKRTVQVPTVQRTDALQPESSNQLTEEVSSILNKDKEFGVPKRTIDELPTVQRIATLIPESNQMLNAMPKSTEKLPTKKTFPPTKSNELTKEVCKLNKDNVSSVPKQTLEVPKQQRTVTLKPEINKITKQVATVIKINEPDDMPESSDQIPKEQRTKALQSESNELITVLKDNESNDLITQRTEALSNELPTKLCTVNNNVQETDVPKITNEIPKVQDTETALPITKSNELTKEVVCIINKAIESDVGSKVTVEIPTENEKIDKTTKENMNMDKNLDTKLKTQSKKTPLISKNISFPVPIKIFEKFVNQTEILDKIVKRYAQQQKMDYKTLRNDENFCRNQFKKFYNTFYIKPNLRKLYNVKFHNAPTDLLKKLWSVATIKETINQSKSQQQAEVPNQQKISTVLIEHEEINRVAESMQPITNVILFLPSNLDEYIEQRVSDSNLRQLIKDNLLYNNLSHHEEGVFQQQQSMEDSFEFTEKLFFQNLSRFHKTKYLISSSFDLKQEIWIATTTLNIDEFLQYTDIYGAKDLYNKPYLLRRFYRHAIEEGNWPVNLYIKMQKFVKLMQLKCVQLNDFNLENISPKLFYWHELMLFTNFDDCVRYDYYKRYRKQIANKSNMHQLRKEYYNRCWCHDQWISEIPRITDQEIIKQVNEIDWSNMSQDKKRSQNVCKQNSLENKIQNDDENQRSSNVCLRRSQNIFTDSSQSTTTTTTQPTPTKSYQISETQQIEQNQRSSNDGFRRSQTIFTESAQSLTTPTKPTTSTQICETQQNEHNDSSSNVCLKRYQTLFTDSSQSTTTTTQPTPTKSNQITDSPLKKLPGTQTQITETQLLQDSPLSKLEKTLSRTQISETQLLQDDTLQKKLQTTISRTQIPETQLLESQKTLEKATTSQANQISYDHTYGIHGSPIPPVGTQNFVDVNNVTLTQSQGLGNNLTVGNEHDPLMCASLNVQEIPITKEIKREMLTPLHDILFLLDSEGSDYTCQPLPENVIEIADDELIIDNDFRMLLSVDSNENTFVSSKKPLDMNYATVPEEVLQMSSTERIVPDADIEISIIDSAVATSKATSTNLQKSTNLNHAICSSSEESVPTIIANTVQNVNNDDNLKASSSSTSTSSKTIMARQIAKERRRPDNNQKSKRQKTQHTEPIGQLRHEYRALPLCPKQSGITNATETAGQSVQENIAQVSNTVNAESGEKQLTISQAFTVDNTLFNSTDLQNVLAQHTTVQLTSDREKLLQQNKLLPFVTIRKKVINSNIIEDNHLTAIEKIITINPPTLIKEPLIPTNIHIYRHLIQFHYVNSLNESDIVKYGLLSHGLGQPYQQAVINIDGKSKCKVYGSLVPSLFSNCSDSLHKDFQFVLNDLKTFHYHLYEKKNIGGGHEDDVRERVLKYFIKSAPIFSNFLLEHQSERFKSGRCSPFERTTLERHSKLNNNNSKGNNNPFTIAIKPHILERMAQLNSQLKI